MLKNRKLVHLLILAVSLTLCGIPELMAQEPSAPTQQSQQPSNQGVTVDPSKGPLTPPPASEQPTTIYEAPNAPTPQTTIEQQPQQQIQHEPLGAATAGSVRTEGGGASRPAGTAIAPAKQHQMRSLLIKFGAVAAAGAALGTVYALTRGTPSLPPNSGR